MGLSKLWGKDSSGAHGFVFSHIKAIYYNFSQNKLLSTKLDEMDAKDTATDNKIGNLSDLTTSVKSSVVAAITEVVSDMGDLSDLDSSVKTSLVAAINEALGNAQTAQNSVGTLSSLTTTAKTSAVAAINELNSKMLRVTVINMTLSYSSENVLAATENHNLGVSPKICIAQVSGTNGTLRNFGYVLSTDSTIQVVRVFAYSASKWQNGDTMPIKVAVFY